MASAPLGLFLFRRDLRVVDNLALAACWRHCRETGARFVPVFVFHPDQIDPARNPYYGAPVVEFMLACLRDLDAALRREMGAPLVYLETDDEVRDILKPVTKAGRLACIAWNTDYTPYARRRDAALAEAATAADVHVITAEDYTLHPMSTLRTGAGGTYQKYTPFYRAALKAGPPAAPLSPLTGGTKAVTLPEALRRLRVGTEDLERRYLHRPSGAAYTLDITPGRPAALAILDRLRHMRDYDATRDDPTNATGTTRLSAYMKFGCVSVREVYAAAKGNEPLVRELYWREFYAYVAYHVPEVLRGQEDRRSGMPRTLGNRGMKAETDAIEWPTGTAAAAALAAWKAGRTGVPLVDAGIRQMLSTGYMHNRLRMITAMFLVKDLHVDWREGERYFAQHLVDYDPASNNGGWQWCASTGVDSPLYFRVFNPWVQQDRFDPEAVYIRRWVPELAGLAPRDIRRLETEPVTAASAEAAEYPRPLVRHAEAVAITRRLYSATASKPKTTSRSKKSPVK